MRFTLIAGGVAYAGLSYLVYVSAQTIPASGVVLQLNFEQPFPETLKSSLSSALTLQEVVDGIDAAAKDPRVKGIIATVGNEIAELPIAQVQELREALHHFRQSGKVSYCHAETFGSNTDYYLASAFDKIVLQPSGWLNLTGISLSSMFLRGFFEKLDIEPRFLQRHEYKNFANTFMEKTLTPAHKEAMTAMAASLHHQLVMDISEERHINPVRLQALIDQGPLLPKQAQEAGLVDVLGYRHTAYSLLKDAVKAVAPSTLLQQAIQQATNEKAVNDAGKDIQQTVEDKTLVPAQQQQTEDEKTAASAQQPQNVDENAVATAETQQPKFMSFQRYVKRIKLEKEAKRKKSKKVSHEEISSDQVELGEYPKDQIQNEAFLTRKVARGRTGRPKIALIYANGQIISGHKGQSGVIASKAFNATLRAAIRDKDIKAIVLRVNSPGGSAVGSDSIWQETIRARNEGLPIVVSMGDYAASGGYFISAAANHIVAQPATITGSIGVVFGKLVLGKFLNNKLGVTQESIEMGKHSNIMSVYDDWRGSELELFNQVADESYRDFVTKVAAGRKISYERAHEIAKGRAWTGAQAKELGLVDELGGLSRAIDVAKLIAGPLPPEMQYEVEVLPRPKSMRDLITKGSAMNRDTEDEDEESQSDSLFGGLLDEWSTAASFVRFLSSLRILKPLMRELENKAQGPQYRMDDIRINEND